MKFTPKTEAQIVESMLWPKGDYDFEVIAAKEKTSSKGKEMIEIHLRITDAKGRFRIVRDYLLPEVALKFRHAAEVCGLEKQYESGSIRDEDFIGKRGRLKLKVEKDRAKRYPDKNVVADYIGSWRVAA